MPITEAILQQKENQLRNVQATLDKLLKDNIPDEEQPEIQELQQLIANGFMVLEEMRRGALMGEEELDDNMQKEVEKVKEEVKDRKQKFAAKVPVPTTKEEFLKFYKKQRLTIPLSMKPQEYKVNDEITIKASSTAKLRLAPSFAIKGKIQGSIEGVSEYLGEEEDITTKFAWDFDKGEGEIGLNTRFAGINIKPNKKGAQITIWIDILTIITAGQIAQLNAKTKGVLTISPTSRVEITAVWDQKGFRHTKTRVVLKFNGKADPSKKLKGYVKKAGDFIPDFIEDEANELIDKYTPKGEFNAEGSVQTEYEKQVGDRKLDVVTTDGKVTVTIECGSFKATFEREDKGKAIGTNKQRAQISRDLALTAMRDAMSGVGTSFKDYKEQAEVAREISGRFGKLHKEYREKAENQYFKDKDGIKINNQTLGGLYNKRYRLFTVVLGNNALESHVTVAHGKLFTSLIAKDPKLSQIVNALKKKIGVIRIELSGKAASEFDFIRGQAATCRKLKHFDRELGDSTLKALNNFKVNYSDVYNSNETVYEVINRCIKIVTKKMKVLGYL